MCVCVCVRITDVFKKQTTQFLVLLVSTDQKESFRVIDKLITVIITIVIKIIFISLKFYDALIILYFLY